MGQHGPSIDWQAIISALDNGHQATAATAHALTQAHAQSQGQLNVTFGAGANAGVNQPGDGHGRRDSTHPVAEGEPSVWHDQRPQEADKTASAAPGEGQKRRRGTRSGSANAGRRDSTSHTTSPTSISPPATSIPSPGIDTHRYHPAHAQAAAAAQAQAQAVVAEALARNTAIPDELFAQFARAHGLIPPDTPATSTAVASPESAPWSVAASPDLNTRIALAQQTYGYVSPIQTHAVPSVQSSPPVSALPTIPQALPLPAGESGANDHTRRRSTLSIEPSDIGSGLGGAYPSVASSGSTVAGSSAPTPSLSAEDNEDKRVRNTLASARFRAKKKQYIETVERNIRDLENQHRELEVEVNDLRKENGLLKEMVQLKYGARQ